MRILIVGLGSMGKRRIRNLNHLGAGEIAGFDLRSDRREEVDATYGINTYADFDEAIDKFAPDALVISTPPKFHYQYARAAVDLAVPCFMEASVVDQDKYTKLALDAKEAGVFVAPSCTMRYFPGPRLVKEIVDSGLIGEVLSINYQTGQYLENWHPWENINDFYVSDPITGACREIVPFEFTWLNDIFGTPTPLACTKAKLSGLDAEIDDIYIMTLRYPNGALASVTVEVLSQPQATRELRLLGSNGQLVFSADEGVVRYATINDPSEWVITNLASGNVESGYINPEEPYIEEMAAFLLSVSKKDGSHFPNTLQEDALILDLLGKLESLA
jgi:predicted dehydrogenase